MISENIYKEFKRIGGYLDKHELISSHGGNISIRSGDKIIIKRRGAMLGYLKKSDLVEVPLLEKDSSIMISSTETGVHKAIYQQTSALAVIHAHPPHAIILSLVEDNIKAVDAEGAFILKKIPVIDQEHPVGPADSAKNVPPVLKNYTCCMIRSHGIFARGITLEDALMNVSVAEEISRIRYMSLILNHVGYPLKKDCSKQFKSW
ncbi:MAG: fuculose phosphate aldolase [Candidatus Lokiarchaeota archaeon]|nr:fuculose phosphate aldolase [Candidatus Lokiarchaeota archaeon]